MRPSEMDENHSIGRRGALSIAGDELDDLVRWLDHARDYLETLDTPRDELRRLDALLARARRTRGTR